MITRTFPSRTWTLLVAWLAVVATVGCSAPAPVRSACEEGTAALALTNGAATAEYLGLAPAQVNAVVAVLSGPPPDPRICSGVVLGKKHVVTAAHCMVDPLALEVRVGSSLRCPRAASRATWLANHGDLDLALLAVDDTRALEGVAAMGWNTEAIPATAVGTLVQLSGFGTSAGDGEPPDERGFIVEPIVEIEASSLLVDGKGQTGACLGDSGGPMLMRNSLGAPAVLGILSEGSSSCVGRDRYIRLDAAQTWLRDHIEPPPPDLSCGNVGASGACLGDLAVRCVDESLVAERCTTDMPCRQREQGSFGCAPVPASDGAGG